jgi:predicted house-cleaning noncanonical NTP pyrophosphatase (MazG superfamily)
MFSASIQETYLIKKHKTSPQLERKLLENILNHICYSTASRSQLSKTVKYLGAVGEVAFCLNDSRKNSLAEQEKKVLRQNSFSI